MEKYSISKLQLFMECPYKYKLIYKDKLDRGKSKYTSFGLAIEDTLEYIYSHSEEYKDDLNYINDLLYRFWVPNQYKKEYNQDIPSYKFLNYDSKKEESEYFYKGINYIKSYFTYNKPEKQVAFELPFTVKYKNWLLTGRIDHIKKEGDRLILIDNKVSSYIIYNISSNLQLGVYLYALRVIAPLLNITDVGFYYLPLSKLSTIKSNEVNTSSILGVVENTIIDIENCTKFTPKINNFCKLCKFKEKDNEGKYEKCDAY